MSNERRKQQKLDKKKKARKQSIVKASERRTSRIELTPARLLAAATLPFGPSYVSPGHDDPDDAALVTVVVSRQLSADSWILGVALVDRTCLGVKSAFFRRVTGEDEMAFLLGQIGRSHGGPMEPRDLLYARSIVYHALDYARALGFSPDPDFIEPFFGPRPAELLDTPWARPPQPFYVSGPRDNAAAIVAQLNRAVGAGNFHYVAALPGAFALDEGDEVLDVDGDEVP